MRTAARNDKASDYLQVSVSCVLAWAHSIGLCYSRKTKGYYVDGHDRQDVLAHRVKWLKKEVKLELKQYLWIQMRLDKAIKHCAEENNSADFRALLEPDINGKASETTTSSGENKCVGMMGESCRNR